MALKYFLVKHSSKGDFLRANEKEFVFVVSNEEELRFRTMFKDQLHHSQIVRSRVVSADELVAELHQVLSKRSVLVISNHCLSSGDLAKLACEAHLRGVRIITFETAMLELGRRVGAEAEQLLTNLMHGALHQSVWIRGYAVAKSALEPLAGALLLLAISPIFLLVALLVRLTSPGPVFYRQTRVGHRGRPFEIIKFRSMRIDAEKDGPVWASAKTNDSRLTPIGAFLRAAHLDELPQIWNVVRGDLSFIGPRPERPVFTDQLEKDIPLFRLRTLVKPGITGWAQTRQGYANSIDDSRMKLELDFYYILKHSPILDAKVVLNTVGVLLTGGTEGKKRERSGFAIEGAVRPPRLSLRNFRLPRRRPTPIALDTLPNREIQRRVDV